VFPLNTHTGPNFLISLGHTEVRHRRSFLLNLTRNVTYPLSFFYPGTHTLSFFHGGPILKFFFPPPFLLNFWISHPRISNPFWSPFFPSFFDFSAPFPPLGVVLLLETTLGSLRSFFRAETFHFSGGISSPFGPPFAFPPEKSFFRDALFPPSLGGPPFPGRVFYNPVHCVGSSACSLFLTPGVL